MTTKIDVSKLRKRPVPAGHKMKYAHVYATTGGDTLYRESDGSYTLLNAFPTQVYTGTRKLVGTQAWLETDNGIIAARGYAACNPKDTPIKKLGVVIAHNRCIKNFESLDANPS